MINEIKNKIHLLHNIYIKHKYFIKKKSYSMDGEDLFIIDYFKHRKLGFYVDVGCYHPIHRNNTFLLHNKGWHGINIDIHKPIHSISVTCLLGLLLKFRKRCNSAITTASIYGTYRFLKWIRLLNIFM